MHFLNFFNLALCAVTVSSAVIRSPEDYDAAAINEALAERAVGVSTLNNQTLQKMILDSHNLYRAQYHAGNLAWDYNLALYAQRYVNKCKFQHSGGPSGENLYAIWPGPSGTWDSATTGAIDAWVSEVQSYNFQQPGFSPATGHFTQVVWKGTTSVGCAWNTAKCNGMAIFSCNYLPQGNIIGYFPANVLPP